MTEIETPDATPQTEGQRKQALANSVAQNVRLGWSVESQSDYQAVLVRGKKPNHLLHLFLTLITLGLWAIVWIILAIVQKPKHRVVSVDEYGNVNSQG